jgi:peptidoglycan/xylan/chitin deacetylase (PgdA/CDA1 family)
MELGTWQDTLRLNGVKQWGKRWIKSTVSPLLDQAGWFDGTMDRLTTHAWTIVLYHRIDDEPDGHLLSAGMCVSVEHFDAQMAYFRRHFQPIRMDQAIARLERGEPLPPRALSVTFDDGYLDNLDIAWPVLQRHQMPATLFVPTGGLACGEPFWWDRVAAAFCMTGESGLVGAEVGLPGWPDAPVSLGFGRRAAVLRDVIDQLWTMPAERVTQVVAALERRLLQRRRVSRGSVRLPTRMTARHVAEMHRCGVEIAAHSVHHPNFALLPTAEVVAEVTDSVRALEQLCQTSVRGFAYPAGFVNADVARAVESCGVGYAVTTDAGVNRALQSRLLLKRIGMPDDPVADFKRAFIGAVERADGQRALADGALAAAPR